jgi:hypothetical protein
MEDYELNDKIHFPNFVLHLFYSVYRTDVSLKKL